MPDVTNELSRALTVLKIAHAEYQSCNSFDCTNDLRMVQRRLERVIELQKGLDNVRDGLGRVLSKSRPRPVDNGDRPKRA